MRHVSERVVEAQGAAEAVGVVLRPPAILTGVEIADDIGEQGRKAQVSVQPPFSDEVEDKGGVRRGHVPDRAVFIGQGELFGVAFQHSGVCA